MMFWYGSGWAWWQGGLMWLGMIAFWGLLVWAVYALVTNLSHGHSSENVPGGQGARRILDERLARGEISAAEYQHLCDLIGSQTQHPASTAGHGR